MKKSEPYPILQIPKDAHDISEPLGTKSKFWYENEKYLFKIGRPGTGENWAEIVASEFENLLKLPCVKYEFASYEGEMGVTCPNFVPKRLFENYLSDFCPSRLSIKLIIEI